MGSNANIIETDRFKIIRSLKYNSFMDKKTGYFARWGKTKEDDPTLCEFCQPTLSSVSRDPWRLGFETATVLDRLMDGPQALGG